MKKTVYLIPTAILAIPSLAFAQFGTLASYVEALGRIINLAIPFVFALALLVFFWGLVKFIFSAGDEEGQAKGKAIMIWGIVALFVMASIWGIVRLLQTNLNTTNTGDIQAPGVL